jgi:predicted Ser/Thr protein kinase
MKGIEGSTLGRYELRRRIAQGGMSEVYLGYDRRVKRQVAVKVLYGSNESFIRRFEREALAIGTLSHNHILPLYDFGEQRPWYYLVMPYIEGGTLRDYLLKRDVLTFEDAGNFLEQMAAALQHAHDHGVVHRDVKPSNILLRSDGYAYLGDFGLAKAKMEVDCLTHVGAMIGTPEYMAPEQSNGANDHRSDIYSLGIILYQMLTGRVPFIAHSPVAVTLKHLQTQPLPPSQLNNSISPAIEAVMLKALAKDPADRYQQAMFFAADYREARKARKALREGQALQQNKDNIRLDKEEQNPYKNQVDILVTSPAMTRIAPIAEVHLTQADSFPHYVPPRKIKLHMPSLWKQYGRKRPVSALHLALLILIIPGIIIPSLLLQHIIQHPLQTKRGQNTQTPLIMQKATAQAHQQATLAAQAHVKAAAGITAALGVGKVLYSNNLLTPAYGWLNDGYQCFFTPTGYHVTTSAHSASWCYYNQNLFSNVVITAEMRLLRGDIYGIVFRLSPGSKAFYVLEINSQGEYRFVRAQSDNPYRWLTLIDWTHTNALLSGYGHTNTILVVATGNQTTIYINRQLIISEFLDSAYLSGFIGFLVESDNQGSTEAVFSNVWVFQK